MMPATKYNSSNAYETDYERYNRTYTQNRSTYRAPLKPLPPLRPQMRTVAPLKAPRRSARPAVQTHAVQKPQEKPKLSVREANAKKKALRRRRIKTVAKCALIFVLAIFMIYRYVQISESGAKINELQKEYNSLSGDAQEIRSKIDKSIDLESLEKRAQEDLGMVRPDRNQIFYVDMNGGDYGESVKDEKKSGSISGASGSMIRAIDMIK